MDKSLIIESLDSKAITKYPVLLRPRRFGKSTFVQMLKCFYDISYKDRYEELFKGTQIYEKHLPSHNSYHVLDFSFAGVSGFGVAGIANSFVISMKRSISDFKTRYPDFVFNPATFEQQNPSDLFTSFLTAYSQYC